MDSLTLSIWQGRGICGPRVLAAGSTLAAGGLGHTAGSAGRGGFKWRTASSYPLFGLFILLFLLLSIFFILWWRKAQKLFFSQGSQDKYCFLNRLPLTFTFFFCFLFVPPLSIGHIIRSALTHSSYLLQRQNNLLNNIVIIHKVNNK